MQIKPLTGGSGAEILGADVTDAAQFPALHQAFADHGVIVVRDQAISPEQQIAFARQFGEIF